MSVRIIIAEGYQVAITGKPSQVDAAILALDAFPDLLAACERLLHELQRLGGNQTDKHEAMSIAAAAIAKAKP